MNAYDNALAELAHIRGAGADDLHGAFKEWDVPADFLAPCRKYLYATQPRLARATKYNFRVFEIRKGWISLARCLVKC